jgi:hypothetical protein
MNQIEETIQWLFENDAKEMKKICNKYMMKFGGISEMDYDDFYSQVGWDISIASKNYKPNDDKSFKEFIYGVIKLSVCKQMTHRNRGKRQLIVEKEDIDDVGNKTIIKEYIPTVSLDAPVSEEDGMTVGEMLAHKSTIESDFFEEREDTYSEKMNRYLEKLSSLQKEVLRLISVGFMPSEILEELHITQKLYNDCYNAIHSYKNISILM